MENIKKLHVGSSICVCGHLLLLPPCCHPSAMLWNPSPPIAILHSCLPGLFASPSPRYLTLYRSLLPFTLPPLHQPSAQARELAVILNTALAPHLHCNQTPSHRLLSLLQAVLLCPPPRTTFPRDHASPGFPHSLCLLFCPHRSATVPSHCI